MSSNTQTIENPVVDAYLEFLKDGKTDYAVVLRSELRKSKKALRETARKRAISRLNNIYSSKPDWE